MEVLAGEIVNARVVALEAFVTAFEDLLLGRTLDPQASVVLFKDAANAPARADEDSPEREGSVPQRPPADARQAAPVAPVPSSPAVASSWTEAVSASSEQDAGRQAPNRGALGERFRPAHSDLSASTMRTSSPRRETSSSILPLGSPK